jgi:hypothetical protein
VRYRRPVAGENASRGKDEAEPYTDPVGPIRHENLLTLCHGEGFLRIPGVPVKRVRRFLLPVSAEWWARGLS